ncbi:MAG: uroporphyrinogen-III C-methyltransferase, partial [Oceanobacter sp.]
MADKPKNSPQQTPESESTELALTPEISETASPAAESETGSATPAPDPAVSDTEKPAASKSEKPAAVSENAAETSATKKGSRLMLIVVLILVVVNLGTWAAGSFIYLLLNESRTELSQSNDRLAVAESQLAEQQAKLTAQIARATQQNTGLGNVSQQLESFKEQLNHNTELLASLPGAERQDWMLAEVEYLLRLANQRLQLEQDVRGALAMLEAADQVLVDTANPYFSPVRADIARETLALEAIPALDRTGAVHRLQSLQQAVAKLDWVPRQTFVEAAMPSESDTAADKAWYENLIAEVAAGVGQVIRIRRHDVAVDAPVSPEQVYYLQQNSWLMLEQAQLALLRGDQALYVESIQRVIDWLDRYLNMASPESIAVRERLATLIAWKVSPELPDISTSLSKLQSLIEKR